MPALSIDKIAKYSHLNNVKSRTKKEKAGFYLFKILMF